jgi:hypothetical protein
MSPRSVFLSRLLGLFALLVSLSMLVQKDATVETATMIVHDRPLLMVVGMITLIGGLAMVLGHNVWSGGALPVIVTLFGWSILIRGSLVLSLSPQAMASFFDMLHLGQLFYLYVAINLVLGLYLTYGGFRRSLPSNASTNR